MRTAIVTLTLGRPYELAWNEVCAPSWRAYAARHGYDVVAIDRPLDTSVRAAMRSPAWQKLLVLRPEVANGYDRIVWIDADIVINPDSPPIAAGVPIDKIGAVDEFASGSPHERASVYAEVARRFPAVAAIVRSYLDPGDYHAVWGLPRRARHILQTGVLVLSPLHHRQLFEEVYLLPQKGGVEMNYEMRPLSFAIQERGLQHLLDPRFNAVFQFEHYRRQFCEGIICSTQEQLLAFIASEYRRNFFLHFAGTQTLLTAVHLALGTPPILLDRA
jgi:hypothetical protein